MQYSIYLLDLVDTCRNFGDAPTSTTAVTPFAAIPYFVPSYPDVAARSSPRDTLLWYLGMCKTSWSFGHVLRHMLIAKLNSLHGKDRDVDLTCYGEGELGTKFVA